MENEKRGDQTRRQLVDAAIDLLATAGLSGTTFVEVSRRCGLTRGAIHHHFKDMDELLVGVVDVVGERIRARAFNAIDEFDMQKDMYSQSIDAVWQQMATPEFRALVHLRHGLTVHPPLGSSVRERVSALNNWWFEQAESVPTRLRRDVDHQLIRVVLSALSGAMAVDAAIGPPEDDPDRSGFRDKVKTIVLR